MKLTWFGGTTIRVYIGGVILVVDAATAPSTIDRQELISGADTLVEIGKAPATDAALWRPRKPARMIDEAKFEQVECWTAGQGALLIDATGEPPLLLVSEGIPDLGRWAPQSVIVICGAGIDLVSRSREVIAGAGARLIALASDDASVEAAFVELQDNLDGIGLVALEAGMALEI